MSSYIRKQRLPRPRTDYPLDRDFDDMGEAEAELVHEIRAGHGVAGGGLGDLFENDYSDNRVGAAYYHPHRVLPGPLRVRRAKAPKLAKPPEAPKPPEVVQLYAEPQGPPVGPIFGFMRQWYAPLEKGEYL